MLRTALALTCVALAAAQSSSVVIPSKGGGAPAIEAMIERMVPGASAHFVVSIGSTKACKTPCFELSDGADGKLHLAASGASEAAYGVGHYFREHWCVGRLLLGVLVLVLVLVLLVLLCYCWCCCYRYC